MSYTSTIGVSLGQSQTGLTLAAQLIDTTGGIIANDIRTGFVEVGLGSYLFTYVSYPDDFRGAVKFLNVNNASGLMAISAINPQESEYADVKTSTRLSNAGLPATVPVFSIPTDMTSGDAVTLRITDDYKLSEGRNIDATSTGWPDLTSSTVTLNVCNKFTKNLTIVAARQIRIELTRTELATIGGGRWPFEIYATLSNGNIITIVTGDFNIVSPFND